jgi:hypothetical protein
MCKQQVVSRIAQFVLHLHHAKIIHFGAVDWIKSLTFTKYNFQLFGATECVLNNLFEVRHSSPSLVR